MLILIVVVVVLVLVVVIALILVVVTIARIPFPEVIILIIPAFVTSVFAITVVPAFVAAVLNITVISYLIPTVTSYLSWKSSLTNKNPWSAVIVRHIPPAIMVDVITAIVSDDILRPPY